MGNIPIPIPYQSLVPIYQNLILQVLWVRQVEASHGRNITIETRKKRSGERTSHCSCVEIKLCSFTSCWCMRGVINCGAWHVMSRADHVHFHPDTLTKLFVFHRLEASSAVAATWRRRKKITTIARLLGATNWPRRKKGCFWRVAGRWRGQPRRYFMAMHSSSQPCHCVSHSSRYCT